MTSAMKHFEQQTYYELLEVPVTASEERILDAYARAMETYSPDSIAVYTLVDPAQLDSLHQRLTQALETLSEFDKRVAYDRQIGVTRTEEELALLRAEGLKRAAGAEEAPASGAGESLPPEVAAPVEASVVPEPPAVQASPAAEAEVVEVEAEAVSEVEPVAPPSVEEARPAEKVEALEPEQAPAAPVPPPPPAPTPAPGLGVKPAVHSRPAASTKRHGPVVPPPLPLRSGIRSSVRTEPATPSGRMRTPLRAPSGQQQLGEAPVLAQAAAIATAESALAQVAGTLRDSRTRLKTVVDIPAEAEFNGELLRRVRESRNMTLQVLAERTRISGRHMENIEADRYDSLPAAVYLRGMLMSIARELGLDPLRVSRSYMGLVASHEKKRH